MAAPEAPAGLDDRGLRLWSDVWAAKPALNAAEVVLLEEACRLADRLDWFDSMLAADEVVWAKVAEKRDGLPSELVVNNLMSEARQHTAELRQVLKSLALPVSQAGALGKRSAFDELQAKRSRKPA